MNNALRLALQPATQSNQPNSHKPGLEAIPPRGVPFTPAIDHWVLQFHGVPADRIDDTDRLRTLLSDIVERLGLTEVSAHSHFFGPGVSTVIILSESHLSAHTWPEHQYMHVDIVTCLRTLDERRLRQAFADAFDPHQVSIVQLDYTSDDAGAA